MTYCSYCGRQTELREAGVATCIHCTDTVARNVQGQLVAELLKATAEFENINATHNRPSGCSDESSIAQEKLRRAGSRLAEFLDHGTIPENLK